MMKRLTEKERDHLRQYYKENRCTYAELAFLYGISLTTAYNIVQRINLIDQKTYGHPDARLKNTTGEHR